MPSEAARRRIIVGIDPGTARCGYGVVAVKHRTLALRACGLITTAAGADRSERLAHLQTALEQILKRHRPHRVAVEELFFSKNVKTAMAVAEARGVVLAASARLNIPVDAIPPGTIKQSLTSFGRASKQQVGNMVARILGLAKPPRPDDVADALACAITCAWREH